MSTPTRVATAVTVAALAATLFASVRQPPQAAADPTAPAPCANDPVPTHAPLIPDKVTVLVPYPKVTTVPYPAPMTAPTRIASPPLPADRCVDPCPDITDVPQPGSDMLSSRLHIPEIDPRFQPFNFGIPVPGPAGPPQPPPPPAQHPGTEPASTAPAPAKPRVLGSVDQVAQETGAGSLNRTDKRWQVNGTDLGIMWQSAPGRIAVAFGDTVGRGFNPPGGMGEDYRSNVLGFSTDHDLADGMRLDSMVQDSRCHAAQILDSRKLDNVEVTTIPTSGFAIGHRQYLSYMSIRTWNSIPTTWWTNYGGIAYSDDDGSTWTKDPYAHWDNIFGVSKFQVAAMVPHGDYVYLFGTPNTRLAGVGLARVPRDQVLNTTAYQYWCDGKWTATGGPELASTVVPAPAAELSVRFDTDRGLWQMSYLDSALGAIVLREASSPQGVWSAPARLVGVDRYPEVYGGFMHPWSTGGDLYFTISTWSDYEVYLMHARLG